MLIYKRERQKVHQFVWQTILISILQAIMLMKVLIIIRFRLMLIHLLLWMNNQFQQEKYSNFKKMVLFEDKIRLQMYEQGFSNANVVGEVTKGVGVPLSTA